MTIVINANTLRVTRRFDASAERVFDAWLDPRTAGKWLFATDTGTMVRIEIDPRTGGRFLFVDRRDGEDIEHTGEYLEIERPRRLVFTFAVPKYSSEFTKVTVEITPLGRACELVLTHEGVLPEWAEDTRKGWGTILAALAGEVEGYGIVIEAGTVRFERLLPGPIERVWAYLTESDKRGQWLASGKMEPRVGGEVELFFDMASLSPGVPAPEKYKDQEAGVTMFGRILRFEPPRLLSFTWVEKETSEVTFELTPEGEQARLTLTHSKLADRKAMVNVAGGWHTHLAVLSERLNGRVPAAFWTLLDGIEEEYEGRFAG